MGLFGTSADTESRLIPNGNVTVSTGNINKDYYIVGIVMSEGSVGYRTQDWVDELNKLKAEAASVGCNGVIYARPVSDGKFHRFIGTAVKLK